MTDAKNVTVIPCQRDAEYTTVARHTLSVAPSDTLTGECIDLLRAFKGMVLFAGADRGDGEFDTTEALCRVDDVLDHIATLTRERDEARRDALHEQCLRTDCEGLLSDARRDAESLADSIDDFIGAQGTAYEPDQYLMLSGVVRDYHARTADAGSVAPSASLSIHPAGSSHTTTTATDVLFPGAA